jgi:aldose 1-epimerase
MDITTAPEIPEAGAIEKQLFGTIGTKSVYLYTLTNSNGMQIKVTNYGGIVTSILAPDSKGKQDDVVLGFDDLQSYVKNNYYFGCIPGRFCGRIAKGRFTIEGKEYTLATNNGANSLHGGLRGFDKQVWSARKIQEEGNIGLELTYVSPDGEEGFPGTLTAVISYLLTSDNELRIEFKATTDKTTVINLTNHSYFNLAGAGNGDILSHELFINADRFLPLDNTQIPTGVLQSVEHTPFDFRKPTAIGSRINEPNEQLKIGGGYDHTWVLNKNGNELSLAAVARDPGSGRVLEVFTTEPGGHLYSGNYLVNTLAGKNKKPYDRYFGFCLETQHYPDSPNKPDFPTAVLKPREDFKSTTVFKFTAR